MKIKNPLKPIGLLSKIATQLFLNLALIGLLNGQNFVKNGGFFSPISGTDWAITSSNCPAPASPGWKIYTPNLVPDLPALWEGSAFLNTEVVDFQNQTVNISQNISELVPSAGNKLQLKLDVIMGEARNVDINNLPAPYINDQLRLDILVGGVIYASVITPAGWHAELGNEFGKCKVDYFNGASSVNYIGGNAMSNISTAYTAGSAPYLYPVANNNWDISIPWECGKPTTALLEIRVNTNMYLNKPITDTRGQSYNQTCISNNYSSLDDIAVDNISITQSAFPSTPALALNSLYSTYCGQVTFNLLQSLSPLPVCPESDNSAVEYQFYKDILLTEKISDPGNYNTNTNSQYVYVVLCNKATDPSLSSKSTIVRELKIVRNNLNTAGTIYITPDFTMCSNTNSNEIENEITPSGQMEATLTYFWEKSIGNINGPYSAASGVNTGISYMPLNLPTAPETVTNYYFRRITNSTLHGLTCSTSTTPEKVIVRPCAPTSHNNIIEYLTNPGGLINVSVPNTLFSGTPEIGTISNVKLISFPNKATSLTISTPQINNIKRELRPSATTTYCGVPAASGCVGIPFPATGLIFNSTSNGNIIDASITIDPLDGSLLVEIPYVTIDNRGFISTDANASILFGNSQPLPIVLRNFSVKNNGNQIVMLTWETEMEKDFSHFEVESAFEKLKFEKITIITKSESGKYAYQISNLDDGIWYFRLKMVDIDGKFNYSNTRSLNIINEKGGFLVQNPSQNYIYINLEKGDYEYELFDQLGKNILRGNKNTESIKKIQINDLPLNSGLYFLRISNKEKRFSIAKKVVLE